MESIRNEFNEVTDDPNLMIVLVVFIFGLILGVVAPGGSNYLISASILISMNIERPVRDEDRKRIVAQFDERHRNCDDDECVHHDASDDDKVRVDTNNRIAAMALFGNAWSSAFNLLGG